MREVISKGLLSEVLGVRVACIGKVINNKLNYTAYIDDTIDKIDYKDINIYELAHMCKEWAFSKHYGVSVHTSEISGYIVELQAGFAVSSFHGQLEYEAMFRAYEWLLNQGELNE